MVSGTKKNTKHAKLKQLEVGGDLVEFDQKKSKINLVSNFCLGDRRALARAEKEKLGKIGIEKKGEFFQMDDFGYSNAPGHDNNKFNFQRQSPLSILERQTELFNKYKNKKVSPIRDNVKKSKIEFKVISKNNNQDRVKRKFSESGIQYNRTVSQLSNSLNVGLEKNYEQMQQNRQNNEKIESAEQRKFQMAVKAKKEAILNKVKHGALFDRNRDLTFNKGVTSTTKNESFTKNNRVKGGDVFKQTHSALYSKNENILLQKSYELNPKLKFTNRYPCSNAREVQNNSNVKSEFSETKFEIFCKSIEKNQQKRINLDKLAEVDIFNPNTSSMFSERYNHLSSKIRNKLEEKNKGKFIDQEREKIVKNWGTQSHYLSLSSPKENIVGLKDKDRGFGEFSPSLLLTDVRDLYYS